MAYNLADRFPPVPKYQRLLDPAAYQYETTNRFQISKAPFITNAPRKTSVASKIWTEAIHDARIQQFIPNCTSFRSKCPRFPYEAFSKDDLEEILCKCGMPCECPTEETKPERIICQGKRNRQLYKGPPPRVVLSDTGVTIPSKRDFGFDIMPDGSKRRIRKEHSDEAPPFYDATVIYSTDFYHGCKWSRWSSKRSQKPLETRPGPADYTIEKQTTDTERCIEKLRAHRRKFSKQPRFIEIIQQRNISEGRPGPSTYSVKSLKGTNLQFLGSKSERFSNLLYEVRPGPADHNLRRDFDPLNIPEKVCHAILPEPSCFGAKASRFKLRKEEGPGPATYNTNDNLCKILKCSKVPFGSSARRFKDAVIEESDEEEILSVPNSNSNEDEKDCHHPTWVFKSKTVRMKPLVKTYDQPSPADILHNSKNNKRSTYLQYISPFLSSEGRFQPWYNWMPVQGKEKTPGPGYYSPEKAKCVPAVVRGPLYRAPRFSIRAIVSAAPNVYNVDRGIETILHTHNQHLISNIKNQHTFNWEPLPGPKSLTYEEREELLLRKAIGILDGGIFNNNESFNVLKKESIPVISLKPKKLRSIIQGVKVQSYF